MELCSSVLNTLKTIGTEDGLSADCFKDLIKLVFDSFLINNKNGAFNFDFDFQKLGNNNKKKKLAITLEDFIYLKIFLEKTGKTQAELKDITASLYTVIGELSRHDTDVNSVR